ncbi:MAG TPA: GNAT family N-acetyltransferase [Candidatus Acidoferrales bacterium]
MSRFQISVADTVPDSLVLLAQADGCTAPTSILAPSLKRYWMSAFIENYGHSYNLSTAMVSENHNPRLFASLEWAGRDSVTFAGDGTADYSDFLWNEVNIDVLSTFVEHLISRGARKITLSRLPYDSLSVPLLRSAGEHLGLCASIEEIDALPFIEVDGRYPVEQWRGVRAEGIEELKSKLRSLSTRFAVDVSLSHSESEIEADLSSMMAMHIERWACRGMRSKFTGEARRKFTKQICQEALRLDELFMVSLRIDNTLAAYKIAFRGGDTIFEWVISFNLAFKKWSPGALLMYLVLLGADEFQFKRYDLMRGTEPYKLNWTQKTRRNLRVTLTR